MESVQPFLDLAKGFGTSAPVIAFLAWWGWNERKDRIAANAKLLELSVQGIEAMKDSTRAIEMLAGKLGK